MYSRTEVAMTKEAFWTAFGRFIALHPNSEGEKINWINYNTGYKDVYFRMDVDQKKAAISIQIRHSDVLMRELYYDKFEEFRTLFTEAMGEEWIWDDEAQDENGLYMAKIYIELASVSLFKQEEWPQIVSFFKPRIIALDAFWNDVKDTFEELR
jgi:Domain of unknown function (DUF4268)